MFDYSKIKNKIQQELCYIEQKYNVYIFYACESGSRAWGFESQDSDYDVRFLYVHDPDWYLTVFKGRDVIEHKEHNEKLLDINGWDIKKSLQLFYKSNPPLLEWMTSPIVYKEDKEIMDKYRKLIPAYYNAKSSFYHYFHMAFKNAREYLQGEEVWVKKYFYVLRPLLACEWIKQELGPVPIEFNVLLDKVVNDKKLRKEIDNLIKLKKQGNELRTGKRIDIISEYIDEKLIEFSKNKIEIGDRKDAKLLDTLLASVLVGHGIKLLQKELDNEN